MHVLFENPVESEMELYPANKKFKQSSYNGAVQIQKNCRNEHDSLLCFFIEYIWDNRYGQYPGCRGIELISWLKSKRLNSKSAIWSSTNISNFTKEITNFDKTQEFNVQLAFELRKILPFLMDCNNNVKYKNTGGGTILHVFIDKYLKKEQHLSENQIYKLRKLFKNFAEYGVLFFAKDKRAKTPIHLASFCKNPEVLKAMVSSLINLEDCDKPGNTALHILVDNCVKDDEDDHKEGWLDLVQTLVTKGANVNIKNKKGITPIHLAAEKFHDGMLNLFANYGADFTLRTDDEKTPLHYACRSDLILNNSDKMIETIDLLVFQGCKLEDTDKIGRMPLHYSVQFSTNEMIERLIAHGANVDCKTRETLLTPLYFAAIADRLDIIKLLVNLGADVNSKTLDNSSPLFMSVLWGSYESLKYLIDVGADIYRRDSVVGFTLLHIAAEVPDLELDKERNLRKINAFINKGFDVNDPGMCGVTPIQLAAARVNLDNVKILIEHGANVDYQSDESSVTALHLAVIKNNYDIAKILIDNGADVNRKGGDERMTPLHYVLAPEIYWKLGKYPVNDQYSFEMSYMKNFWPPVQCNMVPTYDRLIPMLLSKGAKVNVKDRFGRTPLHLVAIRDLNDAMEMILKAGANVNVQDKDGILPIHSVLEMGNIDGLKLLLDYGADINDDDTCEMIIRCGKDLVNTLIQQAIKLNTLSLPINDVYEPFVYDAQFANFYVQCSNEAKALINYRDDDEFSFGEFLWMNEKRQYLLIEKVRSFGGDIEKMFPIYASLIRTTCRESENRRLLLEEARIAWRKVFDIYLPENCVDNIFSYLSNRYLEVFVDGVNDEEDIVIEDGRKSLIFGSCKRAT